MKLHSGRTASPSQVSTSRVCLPALLCGFFVFTPVAGQVERDAPESEGRSVGRAKLLPLTQRPYECVIRLDVDPDTNWTPVRASHFTAALHRSVRATFGALANVEMAGVRWAAADRPAPSIPAAFVPTESVRQSGGSPGNQKPQRADNRGGISLPAEKLFVVRLSRSGGRRLSVREWDVRLEEWGPTHTATVADDRLLASQAARLIWRSFRPVAQIVADEFGVELLLQAGELRAPQHPHPLVEAGDVYRPFFRYLGDADLPRQIQVLPWTFLTVQEIDRSRLACRIDSTFPGMLSARRRRVEAWAIRVRPTCPSTRFVLHPQGSQQSPLVGVHVDVTSCVPDTQTEPPTPPNGDGLPPTDVRMMSDRFGAVVIPRHADVQCLRFLRGEQLMARVPYLPGLAPEVTLQLPSDHIRLEAEGKLAIVRRRLFDTVARRSVLVNGVRQAANRGEWKLVDKLWTELDRLPSAKDFEDEIVRIRLAAQKQANDDRNPLAERQVRRMSDLLRATVDKHLGDEVTKRLKADVDALRPATENESQ